MKKYLLEFGNKCYKSFNTMKEIDEYRRVPKDTGTTVWTHDGHLVNENRARELEALDSIKKGESK